VIDLLELPELGNVPRAHTVYQVAPLSAKVALALLGTDFGKHAGAATLPSDVIARVLRGWLESFTEVPRRGCYLMRAEYAESDQGEFAIELKAKSTIALCWRIGQRLAQAEQLRGLGQSALVALAHASDAAIPILLPQTLAIMAGDRRYMKDRLKNFPGWVMDAQPLGRETLEKLANPRRTMFTGKLARAILRVEAAVDGTRHIKVPKIAVGALTQYPLIVSWEGGKDHWNTALAQITDDFRREQDEDTIFRFMRRPGDGAAHGALAPDLQQFLSSIANTAPVLRAVDELLQVLTSKGKKS